MRQKSERYRIITSFIIKIVNDSPSDYDAAEDIREYLEDFVEKEVKERIEKYSKYSKYNLKTG